MVCDSRRERNKILSVFLTFHLSHFLKFLLSTKRKRLSIKQEYNIYMKNVVRAFWQWDGVWRFGGDEMI